VSVITISKFVRQGIVTEDLRTLQSCPQEVLYSVGLVRSQIFAIRGKELPLSTSEQRCANCNLCSEAQLVGGWYESVSAEETEILEVLLNAFTQPWNDEVVQAHIVVRAWLPCWGCMDEAIMHEEFVIGMSAVCC